MQNSIKLVQKSIWSNGSHDYVSRAQRDSIHSMDSLVQREVTACAADDYRSIQIFELNHVNNLYRWLLEGRNETRSWASVQKGC
jgi:hypothetical protein